VSVLLDTHVLLFWLGRAPRLTTAQARAVDGASDGAPLLVSDITLWEIATLVSLGRIRLGRPLRDWLEAAVAPPLVRRMSITPPVAAEVAALPCGFQRDPADRIIVATARTAGAAVATGDRRIIDSGLVATVVQASRCGAAVRPFLPWRRPVEAWKLAPLGIR
jgi:PIN domain nuclease of toxin-antitoxin system